MITAALLSRLPNVRKAGRDSWTACCPAHEDRSPSLSITDAGDRVLVKCFAGCDTAAVLAAVGLNMRDLFAPGDGPRQWTARPAQAPLRAVVDPDRLRYWQAQFDDAQPLADTVAELYLQARGCVLPPTDGDLRYAPRLPHPSGYAGPALLALVRDAANGEPMTVHRTWIAADGTKPRKPARLLAPGLPKNGGVVMLWPSEAVTHGLGLAEGIESALALAQAYRPAWAALDAGNLSRLPVLAAIESLVVAVDGDRAGREAAQKLAARWRTQADVTLVDVGDGRDVADLAQGAA